ncbi:MAG: undecaprenyl-diphosphate phosphatase [Nanoarchaeota archaeon]
MASISLIQAIILSIVQGITEWIPVSSSGHLILFQELLGFQDSQIPYYVFLHLASVFAIIVFFWKDILDFLKLDSKNLEYLGYLIIATIPVAIFGFFFATKIEELFSNMFFLGLFFIFSGIIVYSTKFSVEKKEKINSFDSIFIGLFQALAVLPGVSRIGMTISSALFRGLSKNAAVKFSFLMAIPVILGAFVLQAKSIIISEISYSLLIISFIITFLVSLITIKLVIKIIKSEKFYWFGVYDILLGVLVLVWSFFR